MGYRVFSLKDVPETEADGIRKLLLQSKIQFYETPSTFITDGAIWVYEESDIANAIQLIEGFEVDWQRKNKNPEYPVTQKTWKGMFSNLLLWSAIAVVLMFVFRVFDSQ